MDKVNTHGPKETGMKYLFPFILFLMQLTCSGQTINNVRASFQDGKITVIYDLTGGNDKQMYNVALYSSHNNYSSPVLSVAGDVGNNKGSGIANRIIWDAQVDLGEYRGALTFRVSADPIPLPYLFLTPSVASSYRRGKQAAIKWEGGLQSENVTIELLQDGSVVQQISSAKNSGAQNWSIPIDMAKDKNYQLRLRSSTGQNVTSAIFAIKNKIPLALKIAPVVVVGGVLAAVLGGGGDPDPPGNSDLPPAPDIN